MLANQTGQSGVTLDRDLANFLDEIIIQRKCDVHIPIIRETLIMGQLFALLQQALRFG